MDRQRRTASKVTDYIKFHLSGDLDQVVQGKVSTTIGLVGEGFISYHEPGARGANPRATTAGAG